MILHLFRVPGSGLRIVVYRRTGFAGFLGGPGRMITHKTTTERESEQ